MTEPLLGEAAIRPEDDDGCPKSVLGKAQLLLAAFSAGAFQLKLTELSRRSGVPKASAYRIAQELTQWGLLERVGNSYQLGIRMFELGQRVPLAAAMRAVSRPILIDLFGVSRAIIHLSVLDGTHVLYLERIAGEAFVQTHSQVGARLPVSCTATGKALVAFDHDREALLRRLLETPLVRPTTRSPSSWAALHAQLDAARERGYAVETEEVLSGYGSVAVPVLSADGRVYAAISATGQLHQMAIHRLVPPLLQASARIGRALDQTMQREYGPAPHMRSA